MPIYFNNSSTPFKQPTSISTPPSVVNKSVRRSIDNTLTVDIISGKKGIKKMTWTRLTTAQVALLENLVDTGTYRVQSTETGYIFDFTTALITRNDYNEVVGDWHQNFSILIEEQ